MPFVHLIFKLINLAEPEITQWCLTNTVYQYVQYIQTYRGKVSDNCKTHINVSKIVNQTTQVSVFLFFYLWLLRQANVAHVARASKPFLQHENVLHGGKAAVFHLWQTAGRSAEGSRLGDRPVARARGFCSRTLSILDHFDLIFWTSGLILLPLILSPRWACILLK